jgi:hypothetical protein
MTTTVFTNGVTLTDAGWFNDVDAIAYDGLTTQILVGGGSGVLGVWTTATGSGSPVRATTPTLVTPVLGVATFSTLTGSGNTNGTINFLLGTNSSTGTASVSAANLVAGSTNGAYFSTSQGYTPSGNFLASTTNFYGDGVGGVGIIAVGGPIIFYATNTSAMTISSTGVAIPGTLGVTGNVAVNTNKFNITAASGNFTSAGTGQVATGFAVGAATPGTGGVAFPATAVAVADVNTLDDYEEGTWTGSLGGSATYNNNTGTYTKIGRQVHAQIDMNVNAIGTGSTTTISGLPFTAANQQGFGGTVTFWATLATTALNIQAVVGPTTSTVTFNGATAANASSTNTIAIFGNSARITFNVHYTV